jgi:hypothetical protein
MSLTPRRPIQHLTINCTECGAVTVRFESFVGDGPVFQLVGTKLSEIMAFMSAAPDVVLCTACQQKRALAERNRKQLRRERILEQMELRPPPQEDVNEPARYPLKLERRRKDPQQAPEEKATNNWQTRRAVSNREKRAVSESAIPFICLFNSQD